MRHMKRAAGVAVIASLALTMAACSASGGSGSGSDAAACEPSDGEVTLTFTSWIPGIEDAVAIWNDANPDIQVEVQTGPSGNAGTYQNFFNQLEAGNAPDLGQIEYDAIPNFRVQDGLEDLAACEDIVAGRGPVRGLDLGSGHPRNGRRGLRRSAGLRPDGAVLPLRPVRAEQHRRADHVGGVPGAAVQIRALGGYITNFSQSDINQFAGFVWQGGGEWFANDGEEWTVDLTSDTSVTVADYWQDLIAERPRRGVPAVDRRVEQRLQLRRGLDLELRRLGRQLDRQRRTRHRRQVVGRAVPAVGGRQTRPPATGAAHRSPSSRAPSTSTRRPSSRCG